MFEACIASSHIDRTCGLVSFCELYTHELQPGLGPMAVILRL